MNVTKSPTYLLRAVVFQNGQRWIAQCLEYDIATQADSPGALLYELERILVAHVLVAEKNGQEPFAGLPRAPERFWEMYTRARSRVKPIPAPDLLATGVPDERRPVVEEVAFAEAA